MDPNAAMRLAENDIEHSKFNDAKEHLKEVVEWIRDRHGVSPVWKNFPLATDLLLREFCFGRFVKGETPITAEAPPEDETKIHVPEVIARLQNMLGRDWSQNVPDSDDIHDDIVGLRNDLIEQEIKALLRDQSNVATEDVHRILGFAHDAIDDVIRDMVNKGKVNMQITLPPLLSLTEDKSDD